MHPVFLLDEVAITTDMLGLFCASYNLLGMSGEIFIVE